MADDPLPPDTTVAELAAQGFSHVRRQCSCGLSDVPLQLIKGDPREVTVADLYARGRCPECGQHPKPGSVRGWRQSDATGYT